MKSANVVCKSGETIVCEGDLGCDGNGQYILYVIEHGIADVTKKGVHVAKLGPGAIIGEMSLLLGELRSATIRASADIDAEVRVRRIVVRSPEEFAAKWPSDAGRMLTQLAQRLRNTTNDLVEARERHVSTSFPAA